MSAVPNFSRFPGQGDFAPTSREERIEARAEQIRSDIEHDPKRLAAIDEYVTFRLDGSVMEQLFGAVADLHGVDADRLQGSTQLDRLYHLAKAMDAARKAHLRETAYEAAEDEALIREERRNRGYGSLRIATPEQIDRCGSAFALSGDEE